MPAIPETNEQRLAHVEELLRELDAIQAQAEQLLCTAREKSLEISRELAVITPP